MKMETLKKITDVDTNVGYIALLTKDAQKKWTKYQTGSLQAITFHGRDAMEMAELCVEQGYEFKPKKGNFILELTDEKKANEIISFIESKKPSLWVATHCLYNNSYDRLLRTTQTSKTGYFIHQVNEGQPEEATIVEFGKGLYNVYQTKKGIECWKEYTPFDEREIYGTKIIDRFVLEEDTDYVFQDPSTLHEYAESGFSLPKGTYEVEIGFDGDDAVQVFRLVRKDVPFTSQPDRTLIQGVQDFLAKNGANVSIQACEELIIYIEKHNA